MTPGSEPPCSVAAYHIWTCATVPHINGGPADQFTHPLLSSYVTVSSPRSPLRSHSLLCIKNHLFLVGIGPILNKELGFI